MSLSSFVPSSCFHGYPSLCAVHYLSLPPFPSLSLSTLFLSFSFCFHLCLPFLYPHPPHSGFYLFSLSSVFHLSLPFKPAIPSCCFFQILLMERERERGSERKVFTCCPYQFCILILLSIHPNPLCRFPLAQSLIYMCARDGVVNSWALIPGLLLCSSGFRKKV